ncbi:hypothetical protein NEUTE1DRAFT_136660 [Neurospora tetrasperma FGSC 2508]|uniref:NAD(P)-binding domain-containing protein n=1 Tax=Neurospora tetrasperma (strain FGSC 2508 / ATCC MYA-4615 / P0657) TaxID=510951 RepID=F8MHE7_NEUT8|nr:uncharacterized protein NEUTE1DRAFT_136660 [Neurospora tetrasperma FGSC 2508]EGO59610.1 hypothetical protein NEUTE1DRAFT_136660 [Neurospora tetrasperma FGSC 2508]EGZ73738.1 hypothetical protein NEUTE2DRAFT_138034 [Neurospora tetrasperma FGSC 2509]
MSTSTSTQTNKSILFISATGGIALATLRRCLASSNPSNQPNQTLNHPSLTITVLARSPSRLQSLLTPTELSSPSLRIIQGNAHSSSDLVPLLTHLSDPTTLVDIVITSIGGKPDLKKLGIDDPHVCETGARALLSALDQVRRASLHVPNPASVCGNSSSSREVEAKRKHKPYIITLSAAGASTVHRDYPLPLYPLYALLLRNPLKDKRAMENVFVESDEKRWTVVRPSMLTEGPEIGLEKVRIGVEDLQRKKLEGGKVVGYTISREDTGVWIFERLVVGHDGEKYLGKALTVTY